MRRTAYALALALAAALAPLGCFAPEEPDCSFQCGPTVGNSMHCPENYTCQADGYCHKNGTSSVCPYGTPADASRTADLSAAVDSAVAPDLATAVDGAAVSDGASGD